MNWTLDIEAPVNGRVHKATVKVCDSKTGAIRMVDEANLNSLLELQQVSKRLGKRLKVKPNVLEKKIEAGWADALNRRQAEKAAEPSSAAANETEPPGAEELLKAMPQDVRDEAAALLEDSDLIDQITRDVWATGVAGEGELIGIIYLTGTSRLLERPNATIVRGPSSSGKSHVIERTTAIFPDEAVIRATQMTPQALFHMKPGSLVHKFVVAGERSRSDDDDAAEATRALREMLSTGKLWKLMPVKTGGQIETALIQQDGPIAYVESTTMTKIFEEDANRCILIHTDEQEGQTRGVITKLAEGYAGKVPRGNSERIVARHHALQRMLKALPVVIPYAERLGKLFCTERVESRRAFPQLMSMIQATALLYQRQRKLDPEGRLVATAADYQIARRLLAGPMAQALGGGISASAQRFFERAKERFAGTFSSLEARKKEKGSRSAVYGWLRELHEAGCLKLVEPQKGQKPAVWELVPGGLDSGAASVLPDFHVVFPKGE